MPLNLLKKYNEHLDIHGLSNLERKESLMGIFNRDIRNNSSFKFQDKQIYPTPEKNGANAMDILFKHLTTVTFNKEEGKREFCLIRSCRLHWIKHHIEKNKDKNMIYFSCRESNKVRTYIYDKDEKYVIVLEPLRVKDSYYLLTAYALSGKDLKRNSILNKYNRRIDELL